MFTVTEAGAPETSPPSAIHESEVPFVVSTLPEFPVCPGSVLPCKVHWLAKVHIYQFWPAKLVVRINVAPT